MKTLSKSKQSGKSL